MGCLFDDNSLIFTLKSYALGWVVAIRNVFCYDQLVVYCSLCSRAVL